MIELHWLNCVEYLAVWFCKDVQKLWDEKVVQYVWPILGFGEHRQKKKGICPLIIYDGLTNCNGDMCVCVSDFGVFPGDSRSV